MATTRDPSTCPHRLQDLNPSLVGIHCTACGSRWPYDSQDALSGLFLSTKKAFIQLEDSVIMLQQALREHLGLVACVGRTIDDVGRLAQCGRWFLRGGPAGFVTSSGEHAYCTTCLAVALLDDPESALLADARTIPGTLHAIAAWVVANQLDLPAHPATRQLSPEITAPVARILISQGHLRGLVRRLRRTSRR